jgi:hypothetical protein
VIAVVIFLVIAYRRVVAAGEGLALRRWRFCLVAIPACAALLPLVTIEPVSAYRVLFPVCGVVLVLVVFSFRALVIGAKVRPRRHYPLLALIWGALAYAAHDYSYSLLAEPQAREWELMRTSVLRAAFNKPVRVSIITPGVADRSTDRVYGDEFGSLSSADPQVAQEMFKAALRERFHGHLPKGGSYTLSAGPLEPDESDYDLLIDLRRLKGYR